MDTSREFASFRSLYEDGRKDGRRDAERELAVRRGQYHHLRAESNRLLRKMCDWRAHAEAQEAEVAHLQEALERIITKNWDAWMSESPPEWVCPCTRDAIEAGRALLAAKKEPTDEPKKQ